MRTNLTQDGNIEHEAVNNVQLFIPLADTALLIAHSYIGQKEIPAGSNAGEFVEGCLKLVGLGKGYAWCMAFVYRCYHEAAQKLGIENPVPKTAGVLKCLQLTKKDKVIYKKNATISNIKAGSQFIMDYGKGLGHTGIVVSFNTDGTFTTIEGNTDANGSRTGGMVCLRTRSVKEAKMKAFIVW